MTHTDQHNFVIFIAVLRVLVGSDMWKRCSKMRNIAVSRLNESLGWWQVHIFTTNYLKIEGNTLFHITFDMTACIHDTYSLIMGNLNH